MSSLIMYLLMIVSTHAIADSKKLDSCEAVYQELNRKAVVEVTVECKGE